MKTTNESIYTRVTNRIVEALESGVVPWQKPWVALPHRNAQTQRPYRGINVLQLDLTAQQLGYHSSEWLTYKQAQEMGGNVRKGERGTSIVWYERREKNRLVQPEPDQEQNDQWLYLARSHTVFNLQQCTGLDALRDDRGGRFDFEPRDECERVVQSCGAIIRLGGNSAHYDPNTDEITLPRPEAFLRREWFYGVAFHELIHWSGAPHRLARDHSGRFGDERYAAEELTAELGASFVSARCGVGHVSQTAAYCETWLRALKRDSRFLFVVARQAAAAADYIAPVVTEEAEREAASRLAS